MKNHQIVLAARPEGEPRPDHFRIVESDLPKPADGQVLVKTLWLSLDPYMRGRMSAAKSYARPVEIGDVMVGHTVGEVVESRSAALKAGDTVAGYWGWQEYALADGKQLTKVDASKAPLSAAIGVLGMPGMTAYTGLLTIGQPKAGETVVVAAASGPVGSARRADRKDQGLPRRRHCRRCGQVPLPDRRARVRCGDRSARA